MTTMNPTPSKPRYIPGIDLPVSPVALGCMSIVANETYGGISEDQAIRTVQTAIDMGITLLDTAPAYGNGESEQLVGKAIQGKRDRIILATKASGQTLCAQEIVRDCEASLQRLQTDRIDLYQVHWNRRTVPAEETFKAMDSLVASGKVRALGVCNYGPRDLAEALSCSTLQTNQVAYNLLFRAIEFEVTDLCRENNIGILCYSPVAQGLLTGRYTHADQVPVGRQRTLHFSGRRELARHGQAGCEPQTFAAIAEVQKVCDDLGETMARVALAWCLHQPGVMSVLAGASRPEQVKQNVEASKLRLSEDVLSRLDRVTDEVKSILGPTLDMWAAESRIR